STLPTRMASGIAASVALPAPCRSSPTPKPSGISSRNCVIRAPRNDPAEPRTRKAKMRLKNYGAMDTCDSCYEAQIGNPKLEIGKKADRNIVATILDRGLRLGTFRIWIFELCRFVLCELHSKWSRFSRGRPSSWVLNFGFIDSSLFRVSDFGFR